MLEEEEEEEEEEESAAIKHQKLTVSNVLKTLELFLKDMVMTRTRRRRMMQRIQSLLLLRRSLKFFFPQLGPGRRRPRERSEESDIAGRNGKWRFGWQLQSRNFWGSKESP
jgi:hypothetical protein